MTHLIIRAVELELLNDMTTEELLLAYRRFRARHSATLFFFLTTLSNFTSLSLFYLLHTLTILYGNTSLPFRLGKEVCMSK